VAYCAELVALVLEAGLAASRALEVAAPVTPGLWGERLREAVAAIRAGAARTPALIAAAGASGSAEASRFADAMTTGERLGVPIADSLRALADDIREEQSASTAEAIQKSSLKVLLPLVLLILPSFVLACLVPLFLGGLHGLTP
jgi:pilus assembly protein TadC